ncbi:DUF3159 domain-containing protein [Mycolicibacterium arseniciresistens]|uniref:DUF3159 domain-containing protein n=1 Tax=Mycolicibacterium arseniciresistens TaxID=3062257 RepID=A0ABT8UKJ0_9MYCO|nr:DUF3159 domain-containing protein [Mycolicibacterium arseniciresistens]MDO3638314.1 DUF3159 domain-containing protein [Mycolicibacterium arseniciresistens]
MAHEHITAAGNAARNAAETGEHTDVTLLDRMGGVSGLVYAGVPTFVYVIVNAVAGLNAAALAAVGAAVGLIVLRAIRKEAVQPAVSGLFGVVLAALIALYTGSAEGYFLPGIWVSLVLAVAFAVSVLVRRPLVGVIWNLLTSRDPNRSWRSDKRAVHAFDVATLAFVAVFAARFAVQEWLYDAGFTGWLAFARIAMGYPLLAVALLVTYWAVRRARGWKRGRSLNG